jgi:hypothetical protein
VVVPSVVAHQWNGNTPFCFFSLPKTRTQATSS